MPVWPKWIYSFGLSLRTAATEWKLRQKHAAPRHQERALTDLLPRLAAAQVWRAHGIVPRMPYAAFRARVPLQTHAHLAPAIERMRQGEPDVLWPGRCALFATTAGTVTGTPRLIPVTEPMLHAVRRGGLDALLYYTVRVRHAAVFRGRHLLLGGRTLLQPVAEGSHHAFAGELSGIAALSLPRWAEKHLHEPGPELARIESWSERREAIIARTAHRDISLVAGFPDWALQFAEEFRERCSTDKRRITRLQAAWPNLECFVHTGQPASPFFTRLQECLGPNVTFHELYAATEGIIAAQDGEPMEGLRVMADLGTFFEFVPLADYDEQRLEVAAQKAVPLADVRPGVDYVILLTTASGLVRYVLGDVVRFVSRTPPRLLWIGRVALHLNCAGEHVYERALTETLVNVCHRRGWTLVNFHVAPLVTSSTVTSLRRARHEWWLELRPGTKNTPIGPQIAADLDAELSRLNESYAAVRRTAQLDPPVVRLVMPGVFQHYLRYRRTEGGQHQVPRCRPDRTIADQLGQITSFTRD